MLRICKKKDYIADGDTYTDVVFTDGTDLDFSAVKQSILEEIEGSDTEWYDKLPISLHVVHGGADPAESKELVWEQSRTYNSTAGTLTIRVQRTNSSNVTRFVMYAQIPHSENI